VKAPLRTKSIGTKVSEEEFAALEATARAATEKEGAEGTTKPSES
jgi:hypothetical protein